MWTVKSDAGTLRRVLVSAAAANDMKIPCLETYGPPMLGINVTTDKYTEQCNTLTKLLREEGVKVYEVNTILKEIVEKTTTKEKKDIIKRIWGAKPIRAPEPDELTWEHVTYGYPYIPYYDEKTDQVILSYDVALDQYTRDPTFMTPIGFVIGAIPRHAHRFSKVVKLIMDYYPEFKENVKTVFDCTRARKESGLGEMLEGGDDIVCDEETIAHGYGIMSNKLGTLAFIKAIFERDVDKQIKQILTVELPDGRARARVPSLTFFHLDTTFNWVDKGKALVMPYVHTSKLAKVLPERKMFLKVVEGKIANHLRMFLPVDLYPTTRSFMSAGSCDVYKRGKNGKPVKVSHEDSFIDWLIREGKLEKDGIITVAGDPAEYKNEVLYAIRAWQAQMRQAPNICQINPGLVIAYERNVKTNENLRKYGIKVKELPSTYLDLWGGPHCMTCPLERDSLP
jgi:arginine deiminase